MINLSPQSQIKVAEPTIERLVIYRRLLEQLAEDGILLVSSKEMGDSLGLKASQVRKDLSYFGEIGKRGVGYNVQKLLSHISWILSPLQTWKIGLVGIGRLGEALLDHNAFSNEKYHIEALFDVALNKIDKVMMGKPSFHIDKLPSIIKDMGLEILILTVPSSAAQSCVDMAVKTDEIKGILNFSSSSINVPDSVFVYSVDISVELEKLLFSLKQKKYNFPLKNNDASW